MTTATDQAATELIDRFNLHDNGSPVDLSPLEEIYRIKYWDLTGTGTNGFIEEDRRRRPTPDNPLVVVVHKFLSQFDRRLTYIHEIAHAELGHEGSMRCAAIHESFDLKQERDAWRFAAHVLIVPPKDLIDWSVPMIAANCQVTHDMVEIWRSLW